MWIEKLKEMSDWKLGEKLYIFTKQNADGYFNCWCSKNKKDVALGSFIVERNGYVSVRYYNYYATDEDEEDNIKYHFMIRAESVYNDNHCDLLHPK
jgi:hypothetical protein